MDRDHVYRKSMSSALSACLAAGLFVACLDLGVAFFQGSDAFSWEFVSLLISLYLPPSALTGLVVGLVLGAWRHSFGQRGPVWLYRHLRDAPEQDAAACAGVLAAMAGAVLLALQVAGLSYVLVGQVARKVAGAALAGALSIVSLGLTLLLSLVFYRIALPIARRLPRPGRIPATFSTSVSLTALGAAAVGWFVLSRLNWHALDLTGPTQLLAFVLWALAWGWFWHDRPAPLVGRSVPGRRLLLGAVLVLGLGISGHSLSSDPSGPSLQLLTDHTHGAHWLLSLGRELSDQDGDDYGDFLNGPDCDDSNPKVHPGAREIPGNGLDDNCQGGDAAPAARQKPKARRTKPRPAAFKGNLLFLLIDTFRADRLGVTGYRRDGRSLTPHLDGLARSGTWFKKAYAQAPNTPRSVPSIWTSRFPSQLSLRPAFANFPRLPSSYTTLFEGLRAAKIATFGYSSHFYFRKSRGLQQGFVEYDNSGAKPHNKVGPDTAAPRIVPKVIGKLEQLAREKRRFALFVHLFEPHESYVSHPGDPKTSRTLAGLKQRYDYEIAFVDRWIGKLLKALKRTKLDATTMVVMTSDHGESFGEHRLFGKQLLFHGHSLFEEGLRVPLLIRLPGAAKARATKARVAKPRAIETPVMLIDIAPTIFAAFGLPQPKSFRGRSLLPALLGQRLAPRPAYAELLPAPAWKHSAKMMVRPDGHKIIYRSSEKHFGIYDLTRDPTEQTNLSSSRPALYKALKKQLISWIDGPLARGP